VGGEAWDLPERGVRRDDLGAGPSSCSNRQTCSPTAIDSRRTMTRMSAGQERAGRRCGSGVVPQARSATAASSRASPAASKAGSQAASGNVAMALRARSFRSNPMLYFDLSAAATVDGVVRQR
jgi:BRCT domain type II-containing protein